MQSLRPEDAIVATYREHGHALTRGLSMRSVMAEMYGKVEGCSRGRGGSMHLFDAETRLYGGNAIVGGGLPLAVGLALADKMRGLPHVTCCFFGEGAAAEGEFHESLNLAALWQVPVLFLCENNFYAMGTRLERSEAEPDISRHAESYRIQSWTVDGMDVRAVEATVKEATDHIRAGGGPCFIEANTYRFRAHSMFDAELYRDKNEVEAWKERDPIRLYREALEREGIVDAAMLDAMESDLKAEVEDAVAFAEAGQWEPVEDIAKDVYTPAEVGA
jgi:pyruvate dehydrogenase E1 component alpha subunit